MKYTVVWKRTAKERLAEIWLAATDRTAITNAANDVDARLRAAPQDEGESREGEFRMVVVHPLGVKYCVSEPDRLVSVVRVWQV